MMADVDAHAGAFTRRFDHERETNRERLAAIDDELMAMLERWEVLEQRA